MSTKFTSKDYAQALFDAVSESHPKDHDIVLDNFVKGLAQNGNLHLHQKIEQAYLEIERKAKGIKEVQVTVAREIEINSNIVNELNKIVAGKLEIQKKVDKNIVGGVVIRIDDTLIDASVKNQLKNLNYKLKS